MENTNVIPKIIHQIWIGSKTPPTKLMSTWREKNPDFEYIYWNEEEMAKRNIKFICQSKIDEIEEINGKADIIRWELLYHYGGVFLDADCICIEPFDNELLSKRCFAGWENEHVRKGLIATGTMGFPKHHPLVRNAINWILNNEVSQQKANLMAWQSVGPGLLTRMYNTGLYSDLHIFPSYTFLPIHLTGIEYKGHGRIYAFQAWGSTKQSYDTMNSMVLPPQFLPPTEKISIVIPSYNTKLLYIKECLESIKTQVGHFHIELVWINDGSDELHTKLLKTMLTQFINTTRFTSLIYHQNETNKGVGYAANLGNNLSTNELIFRMDSDDIMFPNRIKKQLQFMNLTPHAVVCGTQMHCFKNNITNVVSITSHAAVLSFEQYKQNPLHWFLNNPTLCYRKTAILSVGNYDATITKMVEDFELNLRMLKHYGYVYNLQEPLLYYRLHDDQLTNNGGTEGREYWHNIRLKIIDAILNS